jgi:hypothetical protein
MAANQPRSRLWPRLHGIVNASSTDHPRLSLQAIRSRETPKERAHADSDFVSPLYVTLLFVRRLFICSSTLAHRQLRGS